MQIDDELVEVLCELYGKVPEGIIFKLVEFECNWSLLKSSALENVLQSVELGLSLLL